MLRRRSPTLEQKDAARLAAETLPRMLLLRRARVYFDTLGARYFRRRSADFRRQILISATLAAWLRVGAPADDGPAAASAPRYGDILLDEH